MVFMLVRETQGSTVAKVSIAMGVAKNLLSLDLSDGRSCVREEPKGHAAQTPAAPPKWLRRGCWWNSSAAFSVPVGEARVLG